MSRSGQIYRSPNKNHFFRRAGKIVADKIAHIDGVIGIVAAGGIGRGFSDRDSDLDLIVYADEKIVREIASYIAVGQLCYKEVHFDIPVESFQKAARHKVPSSYWSQELRWTLEYSELWCDTHHRLENLLEEKVIFPEKERQKIVKYHHREAEEILIYMFPTWRERGWPYNLADLLHRATEHIILWCYANNGLFRPYCQKWLFYYFENNLIPEARYFPELRRIVTTAINSFKVAEKYQRRLLNLARKFGMDISPVPIDLIFEKNRANWEKASPRTKKYLSF